MSEHVFIEPCMGCPSRANCTNPANRPDYIEAFLLPNLKSATDDDLIESGAELFQWAQMEDMLNGGKDSECLHLTVDLIEIELAQRSFQPGHEALLLPFDTPKKLATLKEYASRNVEDILTKMRALDAKVNGTPSTPMPPIVGPVNTILQ